MIGGFGTAVENQLMAKQLLRGMWVHPNYNEAAAEALEEITGSAVYVMPRRRPDRKA